jgi:hypothetical protein
MSADDIVALIRSDHTSRVSRYLGLGNSEAIAKQFLQITDHEQLTKLKNDVANQTKDCLLELFEENLVESDRQRLFQHFRTHAPTNTRGVKLVSDIDDTIAGTLKWPIRDKEPSNVGDLFALIVANHPDDAAAFPDVDKFYAEQLGLKADDDKDKVELPTNHDILFLTARPLNSRLGPLFPFFEQDTRSHLKRMLPLGWPISLYGPRLRDSFPGFGLRTRDLSALYRKFAANKFHAVKTLTKIWPEYEFVFVGDAGEGDELAALTMLTDAEVSARLRNVFIKTGFSRQVRMHDQLDNTIASLIIRLNKAQSDKFHKFTDFKEVIRANVAASTAAATTAAATTAAATTAAATTAAAATTTIIPPFVDASELAGLKDQDFHLLGTLSTDPSWASALNDTSSHLFAKYMMPLAAASYKARPNLPPVWRTSLFDSGTGFQALVAAATVAVDGQWLFVVSFRGTELPDLTNLSVSEMFEDWWNNFAGASASTGVIGGGYAHGSFYDGADTLLFRIAGALQRYATDKTNVRVVFTGHSQGAGIAAVTAARVLLEPNRKWSSMRALLKAIVLFASPRVLDQVAVNRLTNAMADNDVTCLSYANYKDPVPHLPPQDVNDLPFLLREVVHVQQFAYGPGPIYLLNSPPGRTDAEPVADLYAHQVKSPLVLDLVRRLIKYHGLGGFGTPRSGYVDALNMLANAN